MGLVYLACLIFSILGCLTLDLRLKLAITQHARRTLFTVAAGTLFLLTWDMVGVQTGVFFRGSSQFLTGYLLAPEIPVEEIFFLILLCYSTLLVFLGLGRLAHREKKTKREA